MIAVQVVGFVTLLMMEKDNLKVAAKIICLHPDLFESLHSLAYSFNERKCFQNGLDFSLYALVTLQSFLIGSLYSR